MASIDDLEYQVKKLRQRLVRVELDPVGENEVAINEIVGDGTLNAGGQQAGKD